MTKFWKGIKDNWTQIIAVVVVIGVLGAAYLEFRLAANFKSAFDSDTVQLKLNAMIATKLAQVDLATDSKIVDMDTNIATNTFGVKENAGDIDMTQRQLEEVARILMRPPER